MLSWRTLIRHVGSRVSSLPPLDLRLAAGKARAAVLGLLYPPSCPLCHKSLDDSLASPSLCAGCCRQLVDLRPACQRCARPLPPHAAPDEGCAGCRKKKFGFQRAVSLGVYSEELRGAVLRIKHPGNDTLALAMGRLLTDRCRALGVFDTIDVLVPTPIHWIRRMVRGGSCPELLAEAMAGYTQIPLAMRLLRCRRNTRKQGTLLPSERRLNVRQAYRVSGGYDIRGAHVLLVDDVMTTGATASELARVLRRAGASRITLAAVARGIGFD